METLQQQIAALTANHEFKNVANEIAGGIEHLSFVHSGKKRIVLRPQTLSDARNLLIKLPATETQTIIGFAGKKDVIIHSPYRIDIENPAVTNSVQSYHYEIKYMSSDIDVQIDIPVDLLPQFWQTSERKITDSEYHYFTGYSHKELSTHKLRRLVFKSASVINWYGGNQTLTDEKMINDIIEAIQ